MEERERGKEREREERGVERGDLVPSELWDMP
jgi:hypothetical protein